MLLAMLGLGGAAMTEVVTTVFPNHQTLIFWLGVACIVVALIGLIAFAVWSARSSKTPAGIAVRMRDGNTIGRIGNDERK